MSSLPSVEKKIEAAVNKWVAEFTADGAIEEFVRASLDKHAHDVVARLMGFDNRWGKWEVDHCNGRASELRSEIERRTAPVIQQIVDEALATFKPTAEMKRDVVAEFKDGLRYGFRDLARDKAEAMLHDLLETSLAGVEIKAGDLTTARKKDRDNW